MCVAGKLGVRGDVVGVRRFPKIMFSFDKHSLNTCSVLLDVLCLDPKADQQDF